VRDIHARTVVLNDDNTGRNGRTACARVVEGWRDRGSDRWTTDSRQRLIATRGRTASQTGTSLYYVGTHSRLPPRVPLVFSPFPVLVSPTPIDRPRSLALRSLARPTRDDIESRVESALLRSAVIRR